MRAVYQGRPHTELGNTQRDAAKSVTWLTIPMGRRTHLARRAATVSFWRAALLLLFARVLPAH